MQVGATVGFSSDPVTVRERARRMEEAGLQSLWTAEPLGGSDPFVRTGYLAATTSRATLMLGIVNPYWRHPVVLATGAALASHLSGGRVVLVLGIGGDSWTQQQLGHSQEHAYNTLAACIDALRHLFAGERVTKVGAAFTLRNVELRYPPQRPIPIYTTATGERALRFAAAHADGVYLPIAPPLAYIQWAVGVIRSVLPAGKSFSIAADLPLQITDDQAMARQAVRESLAYYFSLPMYRQVLARGDFSSELADEIGERSGVRSLIGASRDPLASGREGHLDVAARLVPDELVDQCAVLGSLTACRARLAQLEEIGLTEAVLTFQSTFDETIAKIEPLLRRG
jgi:5,10-methylenetetrahydromethanopterin reductase